MSKPVSEHECKTLEKYNNRLSKTHIAMMMAHGIGFNGMKRAILQTGLHIAHIADRNCR